VKAAVRLQKNQTLQWTGPASSVLVSSKSVRAVPAIERWSVSCRPANRPEGFRMYKWIFAIVAVLAVSTFSLVHAEDAASPATQDERIAELTKKLEAALARIEVLEQDVATLKSQVAASQKPGAADRNPGKQDEAAGNNPPVPAGGSHWKGRRFGNLSNGQPITDRLGLVLKSAEITQSDDTSFTVFMRVRDDLTWSAKCELRNGAWVLVQLDVDGRQGAKRVSFTAQRVIVGAKQIEIYWEVKGEDGGTARETYQLTPVTK
jgi:hypothetical protein